MVKVLWLRPAPGWAYSEGNICDLRPDQVESLIKLGEDEEHLTTNRLDTIHIHDQIRPIAYIEILPDDYEEPAPVQKIILDSEMIPVRWVKFHREYSYSPGDLGSVTPDRIESLLEGGFVELIKKNGKIKMKILDRLKSSLKKK